MLMYNLSWHWWGCTVQYIQKHGLCLQYAKVLNVRRWMWWWTRSTLARPSWMVLILRHPFGVYRQSSLECAGTLSAGLALPVSLHEYMVLHTSSAKALFRHPPPRFFFPLFSLSLKGADQFTASSRGVRLIPALCDWLRRHKPSIVRSRSLSPPRAISHWGQQPTLFTSGLCQPVARLRSNEITLIKLPPLPLPLSPTFSSSLVALSPLAHLK